MSVHPINILLVDDEKDDLDNMQTSLAEEGYVLRAVDNGTDALAILGRERIDIIVLDLIMPGKDGYAVCDEARRTIKDHPLQIVLVSGLFEAPFLNRAMDAGGDDFIKKPFSELEFQTRIRAAVIRQKNQIQLMQECEYYKKAVRKEEEISSQIMDQHQHLKQAFDNISNLNQELEKANQELETIARYDMLSGVLNRMALDNSIQVEIERANRSGSPLSGIMLDIDHFKSVNDNYGHQSGDMVIREIGRRLSENLRKYDSAGRYGGEEFFIILPDSTLKQAAKIGDRFRKVFEAQTFSIGSEAIRVTASLGIAQYRQGESASKWIERTDRLMYTAKQAGRNRISVE